MKLKRLSLQGYKTFASRTNFEFDEGITAIVGPNGSGKSNIADAIRWVLGEQSYSTLRGKRTTDMIFAGSQQRARAGMAQTIITLDNLEGWLPIDYSEIEIGRRAHRSGDNEYLLNGQKVRLRDITDLLAKSGLAQRTYTIIGQGLIDQALSIRADERRMLFEEAAGVGHYKQRRAETLRRLQETTHNLERVQDIIGEIRPRLASLRRQAGRARDYEQVTADLQHLLGIWYGYKWEQSRRDLRSARRETEEAQQLWVDARKQQLELQERLETGRRELNALQEQLRNLEQERDEKRERYEAARREVAVLAERNALLKRQLDEHASELPALKTQRDSAAELLQQALTDLQEAQEEMDRQSGQLKSFEASFLMQKAEIERWQESVIVLQSERQSAADTLSQTKGRVAQLMSQLRERVADAVEADDLSGYEDEVTTLEGQLNAGRQKLLAAENETAKQNDLRKAQKHSLDSQLASRSALMTDLASIDQRIAGCESRLEVLSKPGVNEGQVPEDLAVLGQLAAAIEISPEFQIAVRAALAERFLTWILTDEAALLKLASRRPEGRVLAASNAHGDRAGNDFDLERPGFGKVADVVAWADQFVSAEAPYGELARRLLMRTLVVRHAQTAYRIAAELPPGFQVVTTEGFVAYPDGVVEVGGESVGASQSARITEIRATENDLAKLVAKRKAVVLQVSELDSKIADLQRSLSKADQEHMALEETERSCAAAVSQTESALRLSRQRLDFYNAKARESRQTNERLEKRIVEGKATIADLEGTVTKISLSLEDAKVQLETLPVAESADARRQLQESVKSARTILAGRQAVVDSRQTTLNQVNDQLRRRQERFDDLQGRWQKSELAVKESELVLKEKAMEALMQRLDPLRVQLTERQESVSRLDERLGKLQRSSHDYETRYAQARIELTQQESKADNLKERIQADLGLVALQYDEDQAAQSPLPIAEVVRELPVVDVLPEDIEETIQRYRGQLNRIGAVNPEAPAEYDETAARHDFLVQQTEDLAATKQKLRDVIEDLDDLTSKAFADTVNQVNDVFGDVFERLFGGGSAQLALTDPDDLTITGVDIVARLPRRREQGLALLSGGERSLTAAALIFALLKVSPTPFCVLDEVDAMLDEANVNRFRELLAELSERTQFIVITHNRGTVQVAKSVYGVSMGADSASQVISIKPEDYIRHGS